MKKRILLLLTLLPFISFAEDQDAQNVEIGVVPTELTPGTEGAVFIKLTNPDYAVVNLQFKVAWPSTWSVTEPVIDPEYTPRLYTSKTSLGKTTYTLNFNVNGKQLSDGSSGYTYGSTNQTAMKEDENGYIAAFGVTVPEGTAPGFYPIKIFGDASFKAFLGIDDQVHYWISTTTSYIKVGNPSSVSLSLTGVVPSFVTSALNAQTGITSLDLSEATQVNGTFNLIEGRSLFLPETLPVESVSYTRAKDDNYEYGTLCLPYDIDVKSYENYTFYDFAGTGETTLKFTPVTATKIDAGTPVLFKRAKGSELTVKSNDATSLSSKLSSIGTWNFTGTYEKTSISGANDYYIAHDKFWCANGTTVTVNPYRATFEVTSSSSAPLRIEISGSEGISEIISDLEVDKVYNLQGQHISVPEQGKVNIVNGKKTFVK